jgi:hypothetical protein
VALTGIEEMYFWGGKNGMPLIFIFGGIIGSIFLIAILLGALQFSKGNPSVIYSVIVVVLCLIGILVFKYCQFTPGQIVNPK